MKVDEAFDLLKASFEAGRLAHGYIVAGPPREEGTALAVRVLQLITCEKARRPCGECRSCVQVQRHTHPDTLWMEPEKKSRRISIDQIRGTLLAQFSQTSYGGGWKACILVGADRLQPQAANALLKTLEEPPPRSLFLLLTDAPQFLLPTGVSRCQPLTLSAPDPVLPPPWGGHVVEILAAAAVGAPRMLKCACAGRMLQTLDALKKEAEGEERAIADEEATDEEKETLEARIEARFREKRTRLMRAVLLWYRDIFLLACGADDKVMYYGDHLETIRRRAARLDYAQAVGDVRVVESMNRQVELNLPQGVVLSAGFGMLA